MANRTMMVESEEQVKLTGLWSVRAYSYMEPKTEALAFSEPDNPTDDRRVP